MDRLTPLKKLLEQEYVLVQAWKKTSSFIRYHNWFADTLALDTTTANLPSFIGSLSDQAKSGNWTADNLRMVPAPKTQNWSVKQKTGIWSPVDPLKATSLRPLAHVSLKDQVMATAIMLCLSERVETRQGDPRSSFGSEAARHSVTSYGNRLFCDFDRETKHLVHRWGSSKLYRAYFDDYRSFLARPEYVAERFTAAGDEVVIVQSDLKQFYDRVRPELLSKKIRRLSLLDDDIAFYDFADQVLSWAWHPDDLAQADAYASDADIAGFRNIALPQGLASAGFFANIVLLDFDKAMQNVVGQEISPGVIVRDVCRYVDDLRFTLTCSDGVSLNALSGLISSWIEHQLEISADGVKVSPDKTSAAIYSGDEQPLIRQSKKMHRIQAAISGGFDASGGEEVIRAVQGLVRSQAEISSMQAGGVPAFNAIPDVRDETVSRFAAGRFRTTFRSL